MNLEIVLDRLEEQGVGTAGKDLFINFIPQDATGILVRDYFGGTKVDHELPGYFRARFMLIARAKDYLASQTLLRQAVAALTVKIPEKFGDVDVRFMRPMGLPFPYAPTPGQNLEVATNMECRYIDEPYPAV